MRHRSASSRVFAAVIGLALVAGACGSSKDTSSKKGASSDSKGSNVSNQLSKTSCGTLTNKKDAPTGGTFTDYAWLFDSGSYTSFDPAVVQTLSESQITTALFDGLTDFDFTKKCDPVLKPLVAEKFSANSDGSVYTFTIKKGLKFSNGDPVLPSNFKMGWERAGSQEIASPYGYLIDNVKGGADLQAGKLKALDSVVADDKDMTLKVTLERPNADFPAIVSHPFWSPITKGEAEKLGNKTPGWTGAVIGNGPFKIDTATTEEVDLSPNPNWAGNVYGDKKVHLAKLVFKATKEVPEAYQAFESGQGDSAPIPPGQFGAAQAKYKNNTVKDPNIGSYYFDLGAVPQLSGSKNLPLRKAISLAIDRAEINNKVYEGTRTISTGITPPGIPGFTKGLCKYCAYNLSEAKKYFKEWQKGGGKLTAPLKIEFNPGGAHENVALVIQSNLKNNLGIDTTLDPIAKSYFKEVAKPGVCVICRSGWYADYPTYGNFMVDLFGKESIGGNNFGRFNNPEFEKLIDKARRSLDAGERAKNYQEAEKVLLNDQVNSIPLNWYTGTNVFRDRVTNYDQPPLGLMLWERVAVSG